MLPPYYVLGFMDTTTLALIGVVILVAALLSGLVERTRFPQVALFLLLGLALGPYGLGLVAFDLHSQILQTIATLGLVLVLFTDAVGVNFTEVKRSRGLIGLAAGVVIGFAGVAVLERVRRWMGVRRDYESLYALGLAFTAYGAAEAAHGSGFLAAFSAGLTIAASDAELCDCFLDLGQAGAEMFLLFTFVAFGSSLIWTGLTGISWRSLVFALVALGARSAVLAVMLPRARIDARSRRLIVWFGPRALSTLLLVLLPVFAGVPGAEGLFAPAALVVLLSMVVHGGALMVFEKKHPTAQGDVPPLAASQIGRTPERITLEESKALEERGERVILLDVRKDGSWNESDQKARGAIRLPPDNAAQLAAERALPRNGWLVAYCT